MSITNNPSEETHNSPALEEALAALRDSEARLRGLFESDLIGIGFSDARGNVLDVNAAFLNMVGYSLEDFTSGRVSWLDITPQEYLPLDLKAIEELRLTGRTEPLAKEFLRKDGKRIPVLLAGKLLEGSQSKFACVAVDLTESRQAMQKLKDTQQQYFTLVESLPQLVWTTGPDGVPDYVSQQWRDYTGFTQQETIQKGWGFLLPTEDQARAILAWQTAVETGEAYSVEYRLRRADGKFRWFLARGVPIKDAQGQVIRWFGTCTDIEDQKRGVEERKRMEAHSHQLAAIVESSQDAIVSKDLNGTVTSWNPAAERIYGYTAQEMIGQSKSLVIPPDFPDELAATLRKIRAGERIEHYETVRLRKDGSRISLSISVSPVRNAEGEIIGASTIARDITERVEHLREIEALNARLQRSIKETHHRVKNNLQIISSLVEVQIAEAQEHVPVAAMTRIGQHTRSLAAIHDLLTHETRFDISADSISSRAAMDRLIPLLQATTGERRILAEISELRFPVREGASLALLVSEIVSNAVKHGNGDIKVILSVNGKTARLEISDDGPGFPPGFDPQTAANTGLSLIDSTGRHDLGGTISYENGSQGGARVVVTFPVPSSV